MSRIIGTGRYLPERILGNAEIAASAGVDEEWILRRTGIRERRVAEPGESSSVMGTRAARAALEDAGLSIGEREAAGAFCAMCV